MGLVFIPTILSRADCCSARGWCAKGPESCLCPKCVYYEWEEGSHVYEMQGTNTWPISNTEC